MSDQYTELMKALKAQYDENTFGIYVPSQNREVKFKPLSLKQQKDIISKLTDLSHANLDFNIVANNIIKDNCTEDIEILTIDKPAILLSYRGQFDVDTMTYEDEGLNYVIPIKQHVKNFSQIEFDDSLKQCTLNTDEIEIELQIPTINEDSKVNTNIKRKTPRSSNIEDLYKIIGDIYVYEIVKYITRVNIGKFDVKFKDLSFEQRLKLCHTLPLNAAQKLLNYISKIREFEDQFTTCIVDGKKINVTLSSAIFATD